MRRAVALALALACGPLGACWHPTTAAGPSVALALEWSGPDQGLEGLHLAVGYDHLRYQSFGGYGLGGHLITNPWRGTVGIDVRARATMGPVTVSLAPELQWSFTDARLVPGLFLGVAVPLLFLEPKARDDCGDPRENPHAAACRPEYLPDFSGEIGFELGFTSETFEASQAPPVLRGPRLELQVTNELLGDL